MKYFGFRSLLVFATLMFASPAWAFTVATGGKSGFYHNGLFQNFNASITRVSMG